MHVLGWVGGCDGRSQSGPRPLASSPESLGQPAGLTLESSAKSSCCSSVSLSHSDPFLPPTQVPPPPGSGNVPEITLHLPYKEVGVGGFSLVSRTLDSSQHGWGQLQTPTQACLLGAKMLVPAPSQLFQLTVLGRPAQGPLSGAARDLTSSTLADWPQVGA